MHDRVRIEIRFQCGSRYYWTVEWWLILLTQSLLFFGIHREQHAAFSSFPSTSKVSFTGPWRNIEALLWLNCEWLNLMRHLRSKFFYLNPSRNIFRIGSQKRSASIKHVPDNHRKRTERKIDRSFVFVFSKRCPSLNLTTSGWMIFFRIREPFFLHSLNARESQLWERTNGLCQCFQQDLIARALSHSHLTSFYRQLHRKLAKNFSRGPRLNINSLMGWTSFDSHIRSFQIMDYLINEQRSNSLRSEFNQLASGQDNINREQASEFIKWCWHRRDGKRCLSLVEVIRKLGLHHRETELNDLLYNADIDDKWLCWTRRDKRVSSIHETEFLLGTQEKDYGPL